MTHSLKQDSTLVDASQDLFSSLDGLPPELVEELVKLERLGDESLWQVMSSQVPQEQQSELNYLLDKNQAGTLTGPEREELNRLQDEADRVMLRKARAAVLLRFRGHCLPTLDELHKLTFET